MDVNHFDLLKAIGYIERAVKSKENVGKDLFYIVGAHIWPPSSKITLFCVFPYLVVVLVEAVEFTLA